MNLNKTLGLLFFVLLLNKGYSQTSDGQLYVPLGKVNSALQGNKESFFGVGIGVPAPNYTLDLQGETGTYINLRPTGGTEYGEAGIKIGDRIKFALVRAKGTGDQTLGIDNPGRDINFGTNGGFDQLNFNISGTTYGAFWPKGKINFGGMVWMNDTLIVGRQYGSTAYTLPSGFGFGVGVKAQFNQFVGIATTCSSVAIDSKVKLAVGGKIWCEGLKVKLRGANCWADDVFDKEYKLQSLQEVKRYITKNQHLPGIPSAAAIEKDGLAMEEMMKLQMQKIEELTLYVIQLQEEVEKLKGK